MDPGNFLHPFDLRLTMLLICVAGLAQAQSQPLPSIESLREAPPAAINPNVVRVLVSPARETTLVAPMTGRIQDLPVSLGSRFSNGQTLIGFDCAENAARLKIADAELKGAKENYDAKLRLQKLQAAGDFEVALAAAASEKCVGQVELSRAQVAQCSVNSPFAGRVAKVLVKQHQGVNVGTPLADIISDGPLKVRLNAPSRWLKTLKIGAGFFVTIDETGVRYPVKVSAISARVDPAAQTIEVEGTFTAAATNLLPGMSGSAQFAGLR